MNQVVLTVSELLWIVVPAAGYGERMGGDTPKQYMELAGQSLLQRTLTRLSGVPDLQGIVVVLAPDDKHWPSVEAGKNPLVHTTKGGQSRADSVMSGLHYVLGKAPENTWVMVHDAARPMVSLSDIRRLFSAVYNSGAIGGILATPVHDTLKKADDYHCIEQTVSRQDIWQAQTPQLFRAGELLHALTQAEGPVTDEASAMERLGHGPLLVEALEPNFKITRPVDLQIAAALVDLSAGSQ